MTSLLLPSIALLSTLAVTQGVHGEDPDWISDLSATQEVTTEPARRLAQCHWRLDASSVWECHLDGGIDTALLRPDFRASELRVSCEDDTAGEVSHGMFRHVSDIRRLDIRDCVVTRIERRAFHPFIALRHLSLSSSSSKLNISTQAFHHLDKLERIDLSGNHIEYLPHSVFCRLHRLENLNLSGNALVETELGFRGGHGRTNCGQGLKELDVSFNALRSVRARSFEKHVSLQRLSLAGNRIERLFEGSFSGADDLRVLDLRGNRLVALPGRVLTHLRRLTTVHLQNNRLSVLPPRVFSGLEKLVVLNLSANRLTDLPEFRQLNSLQMLDLSHNQLSHLPPNALVSLSNLVELNISHNQLVTLFGGSLVRLRGLTVLRLDHNQLFALQPDSLSNCSGVQRLLLSHNQLPNVPAALQALSLLHELDLSHNRLLSVADDAFHNLSSLLALDLSDNLLRNLSAQSLSPLTSLTRMDVSNNQLRSLQGVLNRNQQLIELNVAGNQLTNLVGVIDPTFNLRQLNASGNAMTLFDYAMIPPQLRQLDVSNNNLSSLDDKYEHPTIKLREIDASGNQLTKVTASLLPDSIEVAHLTHNRITDVESSSFVGKTKLQLVDLSANQLERLKKTSMLLSVERAEFRLAGNPLVCDCHSEWLSEPAIQLVLTDLDKVLCTVQQRGQLVKRPLSDAQFLCPYKRHCYQTCHCCDFDACDCEPTCPQNCTCLHNSVWTSNVIMCASKGLTALPDRIAVDATNIMLDGNDLKQLYDLSFIGKTQLEVLFLNNSKLMSVSNRAFQGLTSLQYLHLEDNQLTRLEGEEMLDLTSLRELYLQNNDLEYINTALFENLELLEVLDLSRNRLAQLSIWTLTQSNLARVSLAENSWFCECTFLYHFRNWLQQNRPNMVDADAIACSSGDPIWNVAESECHTLKTTAHSNVWVFATAAALCMVAAAALLFCVVYRRLGRRNASPHKTSLPPAYDMFVSCDTEDTALASQLAAELPYLRLCLLHQDVAASPDAIVEAVHASGVTVLLLTDSFVGRAWCRFDFKHAHLAALGASRRSLVLVDVDDVVGAPELDPDLVMLAKTCPVLGWRDKHLSQRLLQVLRPPPSGWRAAPPPDDCSDGPVYACIDGDDDLARSPSTALSEKAFLAGPPRVNITVNPSVSARSGRATAPGGRVQLTPTRGGQVRLTPSQGRRSPLTSPGGKVQLTPSYFV